MGLSIRAVLGVFSLFGLVTAQAAAVQTARNEVQFHPEDLVLSPEFQITDVPTTRTYNWVVEMKNGAPDGFYRPMLVVNKQYPGPKIECNEGDTIIVNVKNAMNVGTSLHWHGLNQNGTAWMDGPAGITQCPIPAGGSFQYKFKVERQFGTFWWHAHAGAQLSDGIHGPLIVHSPRDPLQRGVHYDYDQVLIMSDWLHNTSAQIATALDTAQGYDGSQAAPPPRSAMFNGFGTWDCKKYGSPQTCYTREPYELQVYPNKRYRLRLINTASHAMIWNSVDKHTISVIEADDCPISSPAVNNIHRVKSHNGQRYSVVLTTNQGKAGDAFWMRGEMNAGCFPYITKDFSPTALAVMRYIDEPKSGAKPPTKNLPTTQDWKDALGSDCRDMDTASLTPLVKENAPTDVRQHGFFNTNFGTIVEDNTNLTRFFVNNVTFRHEWYRPILYDVVAGRSIDKSRISSLTFDNKSDVADIVINNKDPIDHPYHLHGVSFWIVGEGAGVIDEAKYKQTKFNTTNPIKRDTHVIPAFTWAVFRIKTNDPGCWFMHCHIDFHLNHGFASAVVVQPDVVKKFQIPNQMREMCKQLPPGQNANSTSLGRREYKRAVVHDLANQMY